MASTLLITGGSGFIGSAVVRLALQRGHGVINFDALTYAAHPRNLDGVTEQPGYVFLHADLRDPAAVTAAFQHHRPDAVIHLAAETHVDRSIDAPAAFVETNVNGTVNLLDAGLAYWRGLSAERRDNFRFLHVSTDEVYGTLGSEGEFTEDSPYRPNSPYAASKAAADMMVRAWHRTYGLPALISNCSNNYGPRQNPEKLIPTVILNAQAGRPIPVFGEGSNVRDWLFVEDHASALLDLVGRGRPGEVYTIGGRTERSNLALVHAICSELDRQRPAGAPHARLVDFVTDRPGHDFRYAIDAGKISSELGWTPATTLDAGLSATIAWYLDNNDWCREALQRVPEDQRLARLGLARP